MAKVPQLPQRKRRLRGIAGAESAPPPSASSAGAGKKPREGEVDDEALLGELQWPHLKQQCFEC